MNLEMVPLAIADYEAVFALWKRCEGVGLSDADAPEAVAAYLARNPGMSFVARSGGAIVGAILAGHDGRRGYLCHLAVDEEWRKRGVARRLVERSLEALQAAGIGKAHIFLYTDNAGGRAFWEALGWTGRHDIGVVSKSL